MLETRLNEKVTIQVAAKALNVTPKTIHRWLNIGTLTRVKEGSRTYIPMGEIRALRQKKEVTAKNNVSNISIDMEQSNNLVPVERAHYEGLLTRLGQLEAKQELLLEYKAGLEQKEKEFEGKKRELKEAYKKVQELENQNKYLKSRSLWQRIFNKF